MKRQKANSKQFLFQSKSYGKRTWEALKKRKGMERIKFLASRTAYGCPMINFKTHKEHFYPELDGVIVHWDKKMKRYKSAEEAHKVASDIKVVMLGELTKSE